MPSRRSSHSTRRPYHELEQAVTRTDAELSAFAPMAQAMLRMERRAAGPSSVRAASSPACASSSTAFGREAEPTSPVPLAAEPADARRLSAQMPRGAPRRPGGPRGTSNDRYHLQQTMTDRQERQRRSTGPDPAPRERVMAAVEQARAEELAAARSTVTWSTYTATRNGQRTRERRLFAWAVSQ